MGDLMAQNAGVGHGRAAVLHAGQPRFGRSGTINQHLGMGIGAECGFKFGHDRQGARQLAVNDVGIIAINGDGDLLLLPVKNVAGDGNELVGQMQVA